jgi:predicted nucleic acid-binding protein
MNLVLIDTPVWLTYFRGGKDELADRVDDLINQDMAAVCGTVAAEVVSEATSPAEARRLVEALRGIHWLGETPDDYLVAAELACRVREGAGQEVPLPRLIVAAVASAHHAQIMTTDLRFHAIARCHPVHVLCA